eukprot:2605718-Prorocentrum_lima.AAC.1
MPLAATLLSRFNKCMARGWYFPCGPLHVRRSSVLSAQAESCMSQPSPQYCKHCGACPPH